MSNYHLAYAKTARDTLRGGPLAAAALSKNATDLQRSAQDWPATRNDYYATIGRSRDFWKLVTAIAIDPDFEMPPEGQAELVDKSRAMLERFMTLAEGPSEPALGEVLAATRALAQALG